jgi:hypothetical protein
MKDYQEKTINDLTDLFQQINALEMPKTDMMARLHNLKNFKESARLEKKAMELAAHAEAFSLAKKYVEEVIQPVLKQFLSGAVCTICSNGRIVVKGSYSSFEITPTFRYLYNKEKEFEETRFIGFELGPYKKNSKDLRELDDVFEKWVGSHL